MRAATLIALLLLGCGALPPTARPAPPGYAHAALQLWAEAGYPEGRCREQADRLRVALVDAREVVDECHQEKIAGCIVYEDVGLFGLGGDYAVIVMDRAYAGPWLLAHETVHWLARCSGVRAYHGDQRLFNASGSMQGEARGAGCTRRIETVKHTILIIAFLLAGCATTSKQLELCYALADGRFALDSERVCPRDKPWAECTEAPRLEGDHWSAYETCLAEEEAR